MLQIEQKLLQMQREQKMLANKICYKIEQKMLQKEQNMLANENCVAFYDLVSLMVSYGLLMVPNGLFMAFYGRQNIALIGLASSFLEVIDPHSFGLVLL